MTSGSVRVVVDVAPGAGRINGRFAMSWSPKSSRPPTLRKSDDYRVFVEMVAIACQRLPPETLRFDAGTLAVAIDFYWPTQDHVTLGRRAGFPRGDVDAPIKATLDGIALGNLIDSDARIVELHVRKHLDTVRPRVEVVVSTVPFCV